MIFSLLILIGFSLKMELLILLGAIILAAYFYLTRNFKYWEKRGVKYEPPKIIFGNIMDVILQKKNGGTVITELYRKYENEKVVGIFLTSFPGLIARDPELVHKILTKDFAHFANNDVDVDENVDSILARNMFVQKDEKWKHTRQSLSPAFTISKVKAMFDSMKEVGEKLETFISKHPEELELKTLMALYTSEIVASCGLGIDGHSFTSENPELIRMGKLIFTPSFKKAIVFLAMFFAPTLAKLFRLRMIPKEVPEYFEGMLGEIIKHRQVENNEKRNDMMQYWINLKKKSEEVEKGNIKSDVITKAFTDDDILGGCITFFVEGYETSSMTASFLLHYLATNKDVQEKVKREIDEMLSENGGQLTFEGITKMSYLDNCILETLRLQPAIQNSSKTCTKEYEIDIGKDKPLIIEKGMSMMIPTLGLHTDPKYWDHPDKFDPDRFAGDAQDKIPKGAFLPFGDGPRICIGMRLAMAFLKVGLVKILKDYEIVPTPKTPRKIIQNPLHFMPSSKGGLWGKFVRRA